jgi:mannose-6-phosphate isomerase
VIAPLYLNLLHLEPGEAIYLPAGVLHAYVRGFGAELMASSDNVLRGGLTPKHVDLPELFRVLNFSPFNPAVLKPPPGASRFTYPGECREFSLSLLKSSGGEEGFPAGGPLILVLLEGEAELSSGGEGLRLAPGESAFAAPGENLLIRGSYTLYIAAAGFR